MIEVLKQAIDYIENVPDDRFSVCHIDRKALVLSLKQAIKELESQKPMGWKPLKTSQQGRDAIARFFADVLKRHDFTDYIQSALAADFACVLGGYLSATPPPQRTEQEPVAWAVYCDGFIALPAFDTEQDALKEMQRRNKKWPHNKREVKALYEAPPQRTWVGLTDEEICMFSMWLDDKPDATVFSAIEAKLKEKNT